MKKIFTNLVLAFFMFGIPCLAQCAEKKDDKFIVKENSSVKVHYTGKLEDGTVFDSSEKRQPLEFKLGEGKLIPGFERAVLGMKKGDKKTVTIASKDAYGSYRKDMIATVNKNTLPKDMNVKVGDKLRAKSPNGEPLLVTVAGINEDSVTLDANHPLAGKDLTFEINLVEVL